MKNLSVLITCYNKIEFLGKSVKQIQLLANFDAKIVVIDDGSTDGSKEFLHKNLKNLDNVKLFFTENHGSAAARNLALKYSDAEFFIFWDIDDELDLNVLQSMYQHMSRKDIVATIANYSINSFNNPIKDSILTDQLKIIEIAEFRDDLLKMLGFWRIMYRTSHIKKNDIEFHPTFSELNGNYFILDDVFWLIHFYSSNGKILLLEQDKILYNYHIDLNPPFKKWVKFLDQAKLFSKASIIFMSRLKRNKSTIDLYWYKHAILNLAEMHLSYLNFTRFIKALPNFIQLLFQTNISTMKVKSFKTIWFFFIKSIKNSLYRIINLN